MMFRSLAMNKGFRRLAVPGSVVAAILLTLFTGAAYSSAQAANSARSAPAGWYLALGDTVATGLQPGRPQTGAGPWGWPRSWRAASLVIIYLTHPQRSVTGPVWRTGPHRHSPTANPDGY